MSAELSQKVTHVGDLLKDLSEQVSEMQQQMSTMQKDMNEMYTSIVGDKKFGHLGLVERVKSLETTKKKWESKIGWMYGYVIGAGSLLTLFFEVIKHRFK